MNLQPPNLALLRETDWAKAMQSCTQDQVWHQEGDVWTHTERVYNCLRLVPEWSQLSPEEQVIVSWAAILHDVGKPKTSLEQEGRIRSPKHAQHGAFLARRILIGQQLDWLTRERIVRLVRYHGHPAYAIKDADYERKVIELSWKTEGRLLFVLASADNLGRTNAAQDSTMTDGVAFWRLAAEELKCFDRPYAFLNDQARFLFFRQELSSLFYQPHEEYRCRVTMMCGLPGAGKDTWLRKNLPQIPMVSLDDLREELDVKPGSNAGQLFPVAKERCQEYLRQKQDFAFNATNLIKEIRGRWINLFHRYEAHITIVYLEPPLETIFQQNEHRDSKVPVNVIHNMLERLEIPDLTECHGMP